MKKKMKLLTRITLALFAIILIFPPDDAGAWGSSQDSWSDGMQGDWDDSTTEADCRACHGDLARFPRLQYENPDKHHLLIGQTIPPASIVPYETGGNTYECLSCHAVEQTDDDSAYQVTIERNCLNCHPADTVTGSPRSNNLHHDLPNYRCSDCHRGGH